MNQHNVSQSPHNINMVDCSCGMKSYSALQIASHLKTVLTVPEPSKTELASAAVNPKEYIKHIELATGKKHLKIGGEDVYMSENEVEALKKAIEK